jgi:hypothetical protein
MSRVTFTITAISEITDHNFFLNKKFNEKKRTLYFTSNTFKPNVIGVRDRENSQRSGRNLQIQI